MRAQPSARLLIGNDERNEHVLAHLVAGSSHGGSHLDDPPEIRLERPSGFDSGGTSSQSPGSS